ncbi:MAG TPA: DUF3106 domain-containing protein [Acidobacteriaceae bacterium]|jgi:hypothetical protein|nr:DUF3106 domain-containing protein [Acidobacteriaceae bacterium]
MQRLTPIRTAASAPLAGTAGWRACAVLLVAAFAFILAANAQEQQQFQPYQQQDNAQRGYEHIGPWMASHQNLTPEEQQQALAEEPGFKSLPPEQQQRMLNRLAQLNSMPPEQRQRTIDHIEQMERLTPYQRQQVRGAMAELGNLPPDQRRAVARTFHEFRTMPPEQRQQIMNSPEYQQQFSDQERGTLNDLMAVDPYLPPPTPWR